MTQPNVLPRTAGKTLISPRSALISTLRTWLLYRDQALWAFVSGTEANDPLEEIRIEDATQGHIAEANEARKRALAIAQEIAQENQQTAVQVMREAIDELLAAEVPRFPLTLSHIPGSF
jgi:hypothetical protein